MAEAQSEGDAVPTPPASSGVAKGCLTGCLVVPVVLVLVFVISLIGGGGSDDDEVNDYAARLQCEDWLKEKLKAPSSAKFVDTVVAGGPSAWTVSGEVDAENSFGAMIRAQWTCSIRLDGDYWRGSATLLE